jgi:hypothetical protein
MEVKTWPLIEHYGGHVMRIFLAAAVRTVYVSV